MSPALSKTGEGGMELRGIGASGGIGIGAACCCGETTSGVRAERVDSVSIVTVDDSDRDAVGRSFPYFSL